MIIRKGVSVHITPYKVTYQYKRRQATFDWKNYGHFSERNVSLLIEGKTKVFVKLGDNIVFAVLRHLVNPSHKHKVDFLGLYVIDQRGLSTYCHGLIGTCKRACMHACESGFEFAFLPACVFVFSFVRSSARVCSCLSAMCLFVCLILFVQLPI